MHDEEPTSYGLTGRTRRVADVWVARSSSRSPTGRCIARWRRIAPSTTVTGFMLREAVTAERLLKADQRVAELNHVGEVQMLSPFPATTPVLYREER